MAKESEDKFTRRKRAPEAASQVEQEHLFYGTAHEQGGAAVFEPQGPTSALKCGNGAGIPTAPQEDVNASLKAALHRCVRHIPQNIDAPCDVAQDTQEQTPSIGVDFAQENLEFCHDRYISGNISVIVEPAPTPAIKGFQVIRGQRFEINTTIPLSLKETAEVISFDGGVVALWNYPDELYNAPDEWFWRSTQLKGETWNEFYNIQKLPRIPSKELAKVFQIGHYTEAILAGQPLDKWLVWDVEQRPNPDKTMAAKDNQLWFEMLTDGYPDENIFTKKDVEFLSFLEVLSPDEKAFLEALASERVTKQLSIFWKDEATGLLFKARLDFYAMADSDGNETGVVIDAKTTDKPAGKFKYATRDYNYPVQAALQIEGLRAAGLPFLEYKWLAVQKSWPYDMYQGRLDGESLSDAFAELERFKQFALRYSRGEQRELNVFNI